MVFGWKHPRSGRDSDCARRAWTATVEPWQAAATIDTVRRRLDHQGERKGDRLDPRKAARWRSDSEMLTASALAVTRSSDLRPGHHGGPLHPVAGLYAISKLVERLDGETGFLPVLQHVALANMHINDPVTSPYQLLESEPLDAGRASVSRLTDMAADGRDDVVTEEGIEATKQAFLKAVDRGESSKADHLFLWLWDNVPPMEGFNLLMSVAIPKKAGRSPRPPPAAGRGYAAPGQRGEEWRSQAGRGALSRVSLSLQDGAMRRRRTGQECTPL
jgi:hypothetical protein